MKCLDLIRSIEKTLYILHMCGYHFPDIRAGVRYNNAEHGPAHAEPEAGGAHVAGGLRAQPARHRRLRRHRPRHARRHLRPRQGQRVPPRQRPRHTGINTTLISTAATIKRRFCTHGRDSNGSL